MFNSANNSANNSVIIMLSSSYHHVISYKCNMLTLMFGSSFAKYRPPICTDEYFNVIPLQGGNKLKPQPFRLNWAWISLETQYYLVNEDVKFLEVTLRRRGFLGETSFVSKFTQET